jgi:hypothetical protein
MQILASRSRNTRKKWLLAALLAADFIIFGGTNPNNSSSLVLFAGFLLLVVNFYCLILAVLRLAAWYGVSLGRHRGRFIRLTAGVFSGLAALQSIGELSARDVLVLLPLALLAYLYLSYGQTRPADA